MHTDSLLLNGLDDTRRAMLALLEGTRFSLHLYTPYIDPRLYNDAEVLAALRQRVVEQPRIRMALLLPPAGHWRSACPHLLQLVERLTSAIQLRTLPANEPRERPEFGQGFLIADRRILLHQADPRGLVGSLQRGGSGEARELLNFFLELWEKSLPDPDLRRLHI